MNIEDELRQEFYSYENKKRGRKAGRSKELEERKTEMERLRFVENWTIEAIGDKYGVSRERVRQIIGNSGRGYKMRKRIKIALSMKDKTNQVVADLLGVSVPSISRYRSHQRHAVEKGTELDKGIESEEIVSRKLSELGINNKLMSHHHPFDILLENGKRIDVKSSTKKISPKSQRGNSFYSFKIEKTRRGEYADFIILYLFDVNKFFVIPFSEAPKEYIRLQYPPKYKNNVFASYENRFDLLQ